MTREESDKLEQLYLLYEQPMYRIAFAVLKQPEFAEDAVSEAFIRIIRRLGKLGEPDSPRTKQYIVKVIRSAAIEQYRRKKNMLTRELPIDDETLQLPDKSDVESEVIGRQPVEILCRLSGDDRRLVELRCRDELPWSQVAQELSISEEAARKRFERIRKRLITIDQKNTKGENADEKIGTSNK